MTGEQLFYLGAHSPVVRACVPMNLQPTAPRLRYDGGWVAEFWYYRADFHELAVYAPQFYLALRLPGGHPSWVRELHEPAACLGSAPEIATEAFYPAQQDYLDRCAALIETTDFAALEALQTQWLAIQPKPLAPWLAAHMDPDAAPATPPEAADTAKIPPAENLMDYWTQELARAIAAGDTKAARQAQLELQKAAQN